MGTMVLRDVDEAVVRSIGAIADRNGITVDDQAKRLLTDAVRIRDRRDLVAKLESIAAMTPEKGLRGDSVDLLRDDRER